MTIRRLQNFPSVLPLALLCTGFLLVSPMVAAEEQIAEFRGTESRNTPEFEVDGPWILDWRITTNGAYESAVDISMEAAVTGAYEGRVLMTKYPGNGVKLFQNSGKFFFRVNSSFANWHLKVIELTEEEAAEYTPRDRSPLNR